MKAVNLLPSEHRGSAKPVGPAAAKKPEKGAAPFGAYIVLGLLAFAVAASALTALAGNTIKERKSELAQVTAQAQATSAKATSLQSYADFGGLATQRAATVKGLASARFNWEQTMADLARALPSDVHLRTLNGSASAAGATGATGVATVAAPTIQLTGCTSSQTAVANLMSRLRNVRGVTRVSLAQSMKQATAEAAVAANDGSRAASLCPKGSPPDFDVTMYFERAQASAATAVNPAAAGTTPTAATGAAPTATPDAGAAATPAAGSGTTTASTTTTTSTGTTK